jgi:hypothetical protein
MGETIEYWLEAEFDTVEAAEKFAREKRIQEFFQQVELSGNTVKCSDPHGWRGGGLSCREILQQEIGEALHKHRNHITEFRCTALYTERAPWDSFELLDIEEIPVPSEVKP